VPLQYDFSAMLPVVDRAVPTRFGSMDSIRMIGTDARRRYAFEAVRGPFTAFARGGEVHLRATVAYRAKGYFKPPIGPTLAAGCGSEAARDQPRLIVELATPLTLTSSWHLGAKTRVVRVAPASTEARDRCDVTALKYDITSRVADAARSALVGHLPEIDRRVGDVSLREQIREWWGILSKPIELTSGVWLWLGPERLSMGRVSGRERTLTIPVTLAARPKIITGTAAPAIAEPPLPPLGRDSATDGFHIALEGTIDYLTASRALDDALRRKTVIEAGRTLTVQRVAVLPASRGRLALAVTFAGDASGTLRFVGTPIYDAPSHLLVVPDLDYDLDVDSPLINTFAWLRSDALRQTFRERARLPVEPALQRGRELLLAGLNRKLGDAVTLSATVDSVAVRGLAVRRDGVLVRAEAAGRATMEVRQR
jgi:hypothetical protein